MDDWWREIDDAVLRCLVEHGESSPEEIGRRLGMSTAAVVSVLGMLAQQRRVRISRAEVAESVAGAGSAVISVGGGQ